MAAASSLELNESLGRKEGMATQHANLGALAKSRDDLKAAWAHLRLSLELFKEIGAQPEIKQVQGWLDELEDQPPSAKNEN